MNKRPDSKLHNLKKWLTLPDAAKHISSACNEEVTEADILRLALDGHLKLSVYFVNKTIARRGIVVGSEDVKWGELDGIVSNLVVEVDGELLRCMECVKIDEIRFLKISSEVTTIEDVWDLPMIGSGRLNIEYKYQRLIGGPEVYFEDLGGAIVESSDEEMYQLGEKRYSSLSFSSSLMAQIAKLKRLELSKSNNRRIEKLLALRRERVKSSKLYEYKFIRLGRLGSDKLPDDSVLVLRTEVLKEFKQLMLDNEAGENTVVKANGHTERHAAKREVVLGAALAVLAMWPKECRDKKDEVVASRLAAMVDAKAELFWPDTHQPPLATDSIANEIREWINKTKKH